MTTKSKIEDTDALVPPVENFTVVLGEGEDKLTFVQKPLSFFGKMEFFSVMGKAVDKVLSDGVSISEVLDGTNGPVGANADTDSFIQTIAKLIQFAPEILAELYCVILAVPRGEREYVKYRLEEDLDDDQGIKILEVFADQNIEVMTNFFKERVTPLFNKISTSLQA